jgi:N-acetylmuramoyl-L-alanine amidase
MLDLNDPQRGQDWKITDRGIRRARFNILSGCRHPTIYIEAGFLTNKEEATRIQTLEYRKTLAEAISRSIQAYRAALKK